MNDQKNLFLAIGLSIIIIIFFQILFPTQPIQNTHNESNKIDNVNPSIDTENTLSLNIPKPKEEILISNKRVKIDTPSLKGSINLQGGILDDLTLTKYKVSMEENSKNIDLFSPDGGMNPYYVETGWRNIKIATSTQ